MDWRHVLGMVVLVLIGIYVGAKNPGLVSKLSAGTLSA